MKHKRLFSFFLLYLGLILPACPQGQNKFAAFWNRIDSVLTDHLEIGTRVTYFFFKDETGDFVGTVDTMDSKQIMDPVKFFVDFKFNRYIGMEITWDRVAFNTITSWTPPIGYHNDGTFKLSGPMFSVFGMLPNDTGFIPYAGIGFAFFNNTSVTEGWWHHGFRGSSMNEINKKYEDWVAAGSPPWPNGGYERTFIPDDSTTGIMLTTGCSIKMTRHLSWDLYLRYTHAVIDFDFTLSDYGVLSRIQEEEFDISNFAAGVGLKYVF